MKQKNMTFDECSARWLKRRMFLKSGAVFAGAFACAGTAVATGRDTILESCLAAPYRPTDQVRRDVWRHPYESLKFWGLKAGMTVLDLQPVGGYWTYILAPYLARTNGTYIGAIPVTNPPDKGIQAMTAFAHEFSDKARFGSVVVVDFDPGKLPLGPANSVDFLLSAREIHNWIRHGYISGVMRQVADVLKAGGIFAVEDHRADPRSQKPDASDGYVAIATVVREAAKAGLTLEASSEINANPKDIKNYPFGVWTLPPTRKSDTSPAFRRTDYDAIGESDRMTLRFRKL
ncbi:class I SAM-dependent methyltransferase [Brytella acorum]|uniref:class I SAM-dependent methyltransferase n=1 Tax=Brytella acorum TaxID=2959299 RepID=UPI0025AE205A|nr:methyltransferase [Brytella acorum]MDF3626124.1 methyltransferase [Brytella acorum]